MKKKKLIIVGVILAVLFLVWFLWKRRSKVVVDPATGSACIKVNRTKFPIRWDEQRIPHGDLRTLADAYLTPDVGGDPHANGSLVGGFFKALDLYPQDSSAKFFRTELVAWAKTNNALPYWSMQVGELACTNAAA